MQQSAVHNDDPVRSNPTLVVAGKSLRRKRNRKPEKMATLVAGKKHFRVLYYKERRNGQRSTTGLI